MANLKPLPELPRTPDRSLSPTPTTLSTEFRTHRSALLRNAFGEVADEGVAKRRDTWVHVFEEVLDQLSLRMSRDHWLVGLKERRQTRRPGKEMNEGHGKPSRPTNEGNGSSSSIGGVPFPKEPTSRTLERIQHMVSHPQRDATSSRLLLCVAPHGSTRSLPMEDGGFDLVPANIGCTLDTGRFDVSNDGSNILFGLDDLEDLDSLRLVGGTFTFKGLTSPQQHQILSRLLQFAIYGQFSMILEQHFLKDSHVQLKIARPRRIQPSVSAPIRKQSVDEAQASRGRGSLLPLGFLNIFSRKSGRPKTPDLSRGNSIDLGSLSDTPFSWAAETGLRLRRFSFIGATPPPPAKPSEPDTSFASTLDRVERSRSYLSTSAGVAFEPPLLLTHLVDKEKEHPKRRIKGDEKVGLRTLLGWEGRDAQGKGMSGLTGFVRHQEISILVSHHVPTAEATETPSVPTSSSNLPQPGLKLCGKPQWITYCHFSHDPHKDRSLGEALLGFVSDGKLPCEQSGCAYTRGRHQLHLIHGSVRIVVKVDTAEVDSTTEGIHAWQSCAICDARNAQLELSNGSWLFSFSKFLELLIYSPNLSKVSPPLCEHTSPEMTPSGGLPTSRFNIVRHFSTPMGTVTFSTSAIEDIFEVRVPRIQIRYYEEEKITRTPSGTSEQDDDVESDKRALRREIRQWWECVSDHVDKIEEIMTGEDLPLSSHLKALPRLPSSDDAYESFDLITRSTFSSLSSTTTSSSATSSSSPSLSNVPSTPTNKKQDYFPSQGSAIAETIPEEPEGEASSSETPTATISAAPKPDDFPVVKLAHLRHSLQRMEQNLYIELAKTPVTSLNDVRRQFLAAARGTQKRLSAWKKKHLGSKLGHVGDLVATEPDWWTPGCHAVPGVNIIVREDDWGSIIAFTLSSKDYRDELSNLVFRRATSVHPSPAVETPAPTIAPSFFSVASGYRFFASQSKLQLDPDQDDVVWQDMEPYSAVIMRKEHTRDLTTLLSIRDVLRKGSIPVEATAQSTSTAAAVIAGVTQRSKPDVGVSMQAVDGQVMMTSQDHSESVEKLLHDLESHTSGEAVATSGQPPRPPSAAPSDNAPTINSGTPNARQARRLESASASSSESSAETAGKDGAVAETATSTSGAAAAGSVGSVETQPPTVPPKDPPTVPPKDEKTPPARRSTGATAASTASSFANTIASSLMKFVMNPDNVPPIPPPSPRHGLLNADVDAIDDRPHIKYDWTIGKRLKFSCTIYYAKQFDHLRRRCGIEHTFLQSLSKSSNWAAEGGKSKSNFWKTSDDKFIIKTLVNAWNVADLQFLIDLAPSYFRYMESTANKATVLAKLFGFYTIEIRNLETGNVQSKVDLLVMENLFYDQKVSKTFDLKGIQGRKVKTSNPIGGTSKTLFDGEWIEGLQKTLILVRPHSKRILQEAIRSDAEFLAKSNIMDYSLLLGVDETKKEIACGLVDTIGSYTFAKTLEYKAKNGLQPGKEVTVLPPADYQERFVKTLEGYFVACPDKWSKPLDESMMISDPDQLPSVL